jgi:hypothetical protein
MLFFSHHGYNWRNLLEQFDFSFLESDDAGHSSIADKLAEIRLAH